jgi:hypothetical protein
MTQWLVPPILIPAGLAVLIVTIALYQHFVGA